MSDSPKNKDKFTWGDSDITVLSDDEAQEVLRRAKTKKERNEQNS